MAVSYGVLETAKLEGRLEGREQERSFIVINAYKQGIPTPTIALIASISEEEVLRLLREQGIER